MSSEKQNGVHLDDNISTENGGKNDNDINMAEDSKNLLGIPRQGHRLSFMEEESLKERNRLNLLKQISAILKQGDHKYNKESLHRTFQNEDLLDRIFRLFTDDHLVQEDWFEFLKARLQEEKQLDFVEQVESVAYVLCGDGDINRDSFCKILKNKVVTNKLVRALDAGAGCVSAEDLMELITAASASRTRAGIDKESLDRLEQLFKNTVGDQKEITREQFQKIVVSKNPFFTDRVFQIFDEDDSGSISQREFLDAAARVASHAPEDKLRFLFKVYDLDGDGLIQHRELEHVMRAAMEENNMTFSEQQLRQLTTALFEDADVESRGAITCDALREQLARHGGLLDNLSISIDRWLVPPPQPPPLTLRQRLIKMKPYQLSLNYIKNNYAFVTYLVLFFLVNVGLFVARIVEYWDHNGFVIFARASGQCLNFTSAWVLVLMLRRSLTALRDHGLSALLDRHVSLHKLTALVLIAHAVLHAVMHLCNFSLVVVHESPHYLLYEWLLTSRPGLFGLIQGWANPTGIILIIVLGALAYSSRPAVRRRGCFEVFYFAHLLYIPFWILLILHAPNFWKWFIVPGTIYVIEKMLRLWWLRSGRGRSYICSGAVLPSRVLHVAARRPRALRFRAGDYVFINVPAVAAYEWHPFTITSAPDEEDYIWLHIRAVGEWTNRLYEYFEQQTKNEQGQQKTKRSNSTQSNKSKRSSKKPSIDSGYTNEAFTIGEDNEDSSNAVSPSRSPSPCAPPRRCPAGALSLADSFRHLRTRPAIVTCDAPPPPSERDSILAAARRRLSKTLSLNRIEEPVKNPDPDPEAPQEENNEENREGYSVGKPLELFVDGPYGAASSLMFSSQHAVLVAAGIGVTPFASVLRTLVRMRDAARCDECGLRKVDFIWINREPRSFEWFVSLLSRLELQQAARVAAGARRFLDMHMYVTSALQRADMKAVGLQLALDLLHRKEQRDLITGLKTRTNAGRPNWDKVFARLSAAGEGRVSVFYCGPPRLGRLLRDKCCQFGFEFRKEVF